MSGLITVDPILIRWIVAALAAVVSGAMFVVMVNYVLDAFRGGRGALLARHVVEVTAGTFGLVATAGIGIYDGIPGEDVAWPTPEVRLYLYLISMTLLFVALVEVGIYTQRRRAAEAEAAARRARARRNTPTGNRPPPTGRHRTDRE